ncbi:MAG: ATP-binding protein [Victivallales bacterium]|nr:ATP-binding protein [Victivallales bacterium]
MIDGARRVGKSYIVEEFAQNEYKSNIIIDFSKGNQHINSLFVEYLSDLDTFFHHLSLLTNVRLYPRQSIIVFDEVQQFPPARAAIKHLVKDGRFDYIETGSLVSINRNVKDIVIPSEEERIDMFPMDFEEFLWAIGKDDLMDYIRECFENKKPLGGGLHRKTMELFRQYMIVGGMPQAVEIYTKNTDFDKVDKVKRSILNIYRADISKYATGYEQRVTRIFDSVPSQLQKHEKRFRIGALKKGARTRDYTNAFFWQEEARVVNVCYAATEPNVGLYLNRDDARMKLYMADTGLLIAMAFSEKDIHHEQLYTKLMFDKLEINKGMLIENIVAQMLKATGNDLFFYSKSSRNAEDRMEIDFLVRKPSITSRHNISPVEVKSSSRYSLTSLEKFIRKYGRYLSTPYVLHQGDLVEKDGITYLPLYMASCL